MTERGGPPAWDAGLYARNTAHHRAFDEWFLAGTPLQRHHRVVDLGCGSGDFTRVLADLVVDGRVVGVDPHAGFVSEARRRAGANQRFVVGMGQDLTGTLGGEIFDGVISRAALQWAPCVDQERIATEVRRSLVPGGYFRAEMSGAGNIAGVSRLLDEVSSGLGGPTSPWCFPDAGWYLEVLERAGFELQGGHVRSVAQRRPFTRESLWGWLESQTLIAYEPGMTETVRTAFRAAVAGRLDELRRHDGSYDLTFVRLDILAWAPDPDQR